MHAFLFCHLSHDTPIVTTISRFLSSMSAMVYPVLLDVERPVEVENSMVVIVDKL